jgi:putative zinc finger/helix-turn-helix YgiT family protein
MTSEGTIMENMITTPCCECGKEMKGRIENYRYNECGLQSVVLKSVLVFHCDYCGGSMPQLTAVKNLHGMIALSLLKKESLLTGEEVRFLRKFNGFSIAELAKALGAHKSQISQWENGLKKMSNGTDRLIRLTCMARMTSGALTTNEGMSPDALSGIREMLMQVQENLQNGKLIETERPQQYMIDPSELSQYGDRFPEASSSIQ